MNRGLVRPALALTLGVAIGLSGRAFPRWAAAALPLVVAPVAPVAFGAAGWLAASAARVPSRAAPDGPATVSGRVVTAPDRSGDRVRLQLRTEDGERLDAFVEPLPWPLALGDRIRFRAWLRPPPGRRNPGGRDPASRALAGGVALQAFAEGPVIRTAPASPAARLERAREQRAEAAGRWRPPREAGLVRAIGAGDRGGLEPAVVTSFARSGLAHVLAVSGMHLVVVAF